MATLIAPSNHSPQEDAEALRKAFEARPTDEKTIIEILGHRNTCQRQQIRRAYEKSYKEDLVKRLQSEIKGDFEKAVRRWLLEPADRDAVLANATIKSGKNYHVIVEISTVLSPEDLCAVMRAYVHRYKRSLEEDVETHTSGHLCQLLVGLLTSSRDVGDDINPKLAQSEAKILHKAVKEKKGSYEEAIRILTTRSKTQLIATFNRYRGIHGTSITKKLLDEGSDEFQKALYTAIQVINNHIKYYEKAIRILTTGNKTQLISILNRYREIRGTSITKKPVDKGSDELEKALYTAIRGMDDHIKYQEKVVGNAFKRVGTDEDALTRVIISRAEKDLKTISKLYYEKTSDHLEHAVAKKTSGDYQKFLLTLLGKKV